MRSVTGRAVIAGAVLLLSFSVLFILPGTLRAQEQTGTLTPATLDQILKDTNAAQTIMSLAQVLIGPEEFNERVIEYGVLLRIAQELGSFPELDLRQWFKENMGQELGQADLGRIDLVRRALKTHADLYQQIEEELAKFAPPPSTTQPGTSLGGATQPGASTTPDLAQLARQFQELSDRLSKLEDQVSGLLPGNGQGPAEQIAQLQQEVDQLKARLPDPSVLQELQNLPSRLDKLEGQVKQLSGSLGGLRGLVMFLLVLLILMLIWIIYLRVRELARTVR